MGIKSWKKEEEGRKTGCETPCGAEGVELRTQQSDLVSRQKGNSHPECCLTHLFQSTASGIDTNTPYPQWWNLIICSCQLHFQMYLYFQTNNICCLTNNIWKYKACLSKVHLRICIGVNPAKCVGHLHIKRGGNWGSQRKQKWTFRSTAEGCREESQDRLRRGRETQRTTQPDRQQDRNTRKNLVTQHDESGHLDLG